MSDPSGGPFRRAERPAGGRGEESAAVGVHDVEHPSARGRVDDLRPVAGHIRRGDHVRRVGPVGDDLRHVAPVRSHREQLPAGLEEDPRLDPRRDDLPYRAVSEAVVRRAGRASCERVALERALKLAGVEVGVPLEQLGSSAGHDGRGERRAREPLHSAGSRPRRTIGGDQIGLDPAVDRRSLRRVGGELRHERAVLARCDRAGRRGRLDHAAVDVTVLEPGIEIGVDGEVESRRAGGAVADDGDAVVVQRGEGCGEARLLDRGKQPRGLVVVGDGHQLARTLVDHEQVEVLGRHGPAVPAQGDAGLVASVEEDRVERIAAAEVVEAGFAGGRDEGARPVRKPVVAGRSDPQDPVRTRLRDARIRRAGPAAPVAATRSGPADCVHDHLHAGSDRVVDGLRERNLAVDADQQEPCPRRGVAHGLPDVGPMLRAAAAGRRVEPAAAVVDRPHDSRRDAIERLVQVEAHVDDGDLHAGPVVGGRAGGGRGVPSPPSPARMPARRRARRGARAGAHRRRPGSAPSDASEDDRTRASTSPPASPIRAAWCRAAAPAPAGSGRAAAARRREPSCLSWRAAACVQMHARPSS